MSGGSAWGVLEVVGQPPPLGPSKEPWVLLREATFLLATPRCRKAKTADLLPGPGTSPFAALLKHLSA